MNKGMLCRYGLVLFAALMLSGCPDEYSGIEDVEVSFDMQDRFGRSKRAFWLHEEIRFEFEIRNKSSRAVTLAYSPPIWTLEVRRADNGEPVWNPHYRSAFITPVLKLEIKAGESLTLVELWDMHPTPELADEILPGDYHAVPGLYLSEWDGDGVVQLDETDSIPFTVDY